MQKHEQLMRLASYFSVIAAATIIGLKLYGWFATDSLSLMSSLVDSVLDILASLISLAAVHYSLKPADEDHRFGHGKAQEIAAFAQGTFIAGSALFILVEAVSRFITPHEITRPDSGINIMIISTVLISLLIAFQLYVVKQTKSSAIKADSVHYQVDFLVNFAVILSLIASKHFDIRTLDPFIATLIAVYISHGAYKVSKEAFDRLMDKEFPDEEREKIINAILKHKEIKGVHDLRTRSSGIQPFIQFHLELDGKISLNEAHRIGEEVEKLVLEVYPKAEVLIHQDPADNEKVPLIKNQILKI